MTIGDGIKRLPLVHDVLRSSENAELSRAYLQQLAAIAAAEHVARLLAQPRYEEPGRLNRFERQMFSQNGEDGILEEIFARIGTTNRAFVELGVGDGLENNTLARLVLGWKGAWVEADGGHARRIRKSLAPYLAAGQLVVGEARVTAENVDQLLWAVSVPDEPDLLSIDIDGNDYWVWKALRRVRPRVVVIEYNAVLPPPARLTIRYDPDFVHDGSAYYGASLSALAALGEEKGYHLVGCDLAGVNAFFVRHELCGHHFAAPFTAEHHFEPPRHYLARRAGHRPGAGAFESV